ncbi:MAG: tRNA (adenosine(37)-N6)-threonylcarbamoyltransferase complex dimerization subunit type 1 TsaB [Phycisphaerales bacterium]
MTGIVLAIEASNPSSSREDEGSVAVCRASDSGDLETMAFEALRAGSRHDDALMRAVDSACKSAGIEPKAITRVAVSAGPGGYTGLRIALTTAKMLGETLGAELVAVPTARVAAFGVAEDHPEVVSCVVALASKRGNAWLQPFERVEASRAGMLGDAGALRELIESFGVRAVIADAHLPDAMREVTRDIGVPVLPPRLDAALCARAALGLPPVPVDALAPIYPREPEAVRKWNERGE